jgi:hypothetical protein
MHDITSLREGSFAPEWKTIYRHPSTVSSRDPVLKKPENEHRSFVGCQRQWHYYSSFNRIVRVISVYRIKYSSAKLEINSKPFWLLICDSPSEWSEGTTVATTRNCYGETTPMNGMTYPGAYPDQMRVVDTVIRGMHSPAYLLDITMLSELRKDGHPSIYSGDLSPQQRADPSGSADCSHWCLPGLPDTWNQLFYAALFF